MKVSKWKRALPRSQSKQMQLDAEGGAQGHRLRQSCDYYEPSQPAHGVHAGKRQSRRRRGPYHMFRLQRTAKRTPSGWYYLMVAMISTTQYTLTVYCSTHCVGGGRNGPGLRSKQGGTALLISNRAALLVPAVWTTYW